MDETLKEFKKEAFKRKVKSGFDTVVSKGKAAVNWGIEHKEVVIPVAIAGSGAVKKMASARAAHLEDVSRQTRFYNPRTGTYAYAKRIPKKKEMLEIESRYAKGESYRAILDDMGLLK